MPLGLLAIGSRLVDENVVVVDGRFDLAPEARVAELAEHASCLAVGVRTGPPLRDALRVSTAARAVNPRLTIVWGGPHATLAPESCLAVPAVDACVCGAGEDAMPALIAAVRHGRPLDGIAGVAVADAPPPSAQPAPAPEHWPRACYSLLAVERYFEARAARRLDYCTSRGARGGAAFCALPADRVIGELGELVDRHGLDEVLLRDEDFFAEPPRAEAIVAGLAEGDVRLRWSVGLRVEDVLEGGHDRLRLLGASGCRRIHFRVAPALQTNAARDRVLDTAALLHAAGITARFELELADAGDRLASLKAAVSLARALSARGAGFETLLRRRLEPSPSDRSDLEAWIASAEAPWADERAAKRLSRASFFFREAQRPPGRRLGKHLLRTLSLLRVRLGFFALDLERVAVDLSALLRTGRPRALRRLD
jgi:hypothetical protein